MQQANFSLAFLKIYLFFFVLYFIHRQVTLKILIALAHLSLLPPQQNGRHIFLSLVMVTI